MRGVRAAGHAEEEQKVRKGRSLRLLLDLKDLEDPGPSVGTWPADLLAFAEPNQARSHGGDYRDPPGFDVCLVGEHETNTAGRPGGVIDKLHLRAKRYHIFRERTRRMDMRAVDLLEEQPGEPRCAMLDPEREIRDPVVIGFGDMDRRPLFGRLLLFETAHVSSPIGAWVSKMALANAKVIIGYFACPQIR